MWAGYAVNLCTWSRLGWFVIYVAGHELHGLISMRSKRDYVRLTDPPLAFFVLVVDALPVLSLFLFVLASSSSPCSLRLLDPPRDLERAPVCRLTPRDQSLRSRSCASGDASCRPCWRTTVRQLSLYACSSSSCSSAAKRGN